MLKLFRHKPYSVSFSLLVVSIALSIWLLLRVVLSVQVGLSQLSIKELIGIFVNGFWFDISALAYLVVPWLLISLLMPNILRSKRWVNHIRWGVAGILTFCLLFSAVAEYIFWQEFTTRFNFIAVDYLIYTNEVIGNIRESYPVPLILVGIALIAFLIVFSLSKVIRFETQQRSAKRKLGLVLMTIALPLLSFQLANVDQMAFSKNAYANELSGNGVFSFSAAARRNELDYDQFYKTIPQSQALSVLKSVGVNRKTTSEIIAAENSGL